MNWRWVEQSPMRDGSGSIEVNGHLFKVVQQDLVTTSHRVAFKDGIEVARAGSFTRLVRKLASKFKEPSGD